MGAEEVWLQIQKINESVCINRLYGLEGTI
ncbi:MAG: hypothetical protein Q4F05_11775 [bacterium]|nr:hypothetical protein [bacterium]